MSEVVVVHTVRLQEAHAADALAADDDALVAQPGGDWLHAAAEDHELGVDLLQILFVSALVIGPLFIAPLHVVVVELAAVRAGEQGEDLVIFIKEDLSMKLTDGLWHMLRMQLNLWEVLEHKDHAHGIRHES